MTTADTAVRLCTLCAQPNQPFHQSSDCHHEFSTDNSLTPKNLKERKGDPQRPANANSATPLSVEGAVDTSDAKERSQTSSSERSNSAEGNDPLVPDVETSLGGSEDATRASNLIEVLKRSSDPVLRMALIDKGILSTDDLTAAETKIAAMIGQPIDQIFRMRSLGSSQVSEQ